MLYFTKIPIKADITADFPLSFKFDLPVMITFTD